MPKTVTAGMRTHLDGTVTTLATLWRITRTDGQVFYFTDHDSDVVFDSNTYLANSGYSRSAIANNSSLAVDNLDVAGIFTSDSITEEDMRAGLFDYAEVRLSTVNWQDPDGDGEIKIRRGYLGELVITKQGAFRTELRGLTQLLSQQIIEVYQPECRVDLGSVKCGVAIFPSVLGRNQAVTVGTAYRVPTSAVNFSITQAINNSGFEADALGDAATITGWTIASGDWDIHDATNNGLAADTGTQYLEGGTGSSGEVYQDIDLTDLLPNLAEIDVGNVFATFSIRRANSAGGSDTGRVRVEFLNAAGTVLTTAYDSGNEAIAPTDTWVTRSMASTALTANTRTIRIRLNYTNVAGPQSETSFDTASLGLVDVGTTIAEANLQEQYENRIYRVTVAGTTDVAQPVYDEDIGDPTVDGTATLVAEDAFMRHGEITSAYSRRVFILSVSEARAVNDWFNVGAITFESGANAGFTTEIKDWTQSSGRLELFLPTPFDVSAGTKVRLYPGCDKRAATCIAKFDNILNFRGEPFIPGIDELVNYPDAK